MDHWERNKIAILLQEAGKIALSFIHAPETKIKADHTLVTAADKAVENFLCGKLEDQANGIRIIGEETYESHSAEYLNAALQGKTWIIDPIDGTALFAHNIPLWGISIGFAENGSIREGAVFIPETGEMMLSDSGTTYYAKMTNTPSDQWDFPALLSPLAPPDVQFDETGIINLSQKLAKQAVIRGSNTVHALCTSIYSGVLLATGRHIAFTLSAKLWDFAGILPCLKNLGFHAKMRNGEDLVSLKITPGIYNLDFSSKRAFAVNEPTFCAASQEIADKVTELCLIQNVW